MRRSLPLAGFVLLSLPALACADDRPLLQRIAERTPAPRTPVEHTAQRAGFPLSVHNHAVPSVTRFDYGGYIGGATVKNNNLFARGPGSATGPVQDGVFGTDYAGVRSNLGRLFLAPSDDPSRGRDFARGYSPEGPRVTDVFALRPFRKAVLETRADREKRTHAAEGHGKDGGEGKGGGH